MRTSLHRARIFGVFTLLSWAAAGCGDSTGTGSGAGGSGGDELGGGGVGAGGSGGGGLQCGAGQTNCSGICATLSSDEEHCGACGNACPANQSCQDGACSAACGQGEVRCGTTCVDLFSDDDNCGACGNACPGEEVCESGACKLKCVGGATQCGSECVDLDNDPDHCGACGTECAVGQVCSAAECGLVCGGGTTNCDGACVDLQSNLEHCGTCGAECAAGQVCSGGECGLVCSQGTTECDGACVDLGSSESNCGACGQSCDQGEVCESGLCEVLCPNGFEACDGVCVDLATNSSNCGACGQACIAGPNSEAICQGGACDLACVGGAADCDGAPETGCEVSILTDSANCGGCGQMCGAGELCGGGVCEPPVRNLLLCGTSDRDVTTFIPPGVNLNLVLSCVPDSNTQAMLISRSGESLYDPATVRDYVASGGRVLTEVFVSRKVFEDVFEVPTTYGAFTGGCTDVLPSVVQFSPNDPFWQVNAFAPPVSGPGCGNNVSGFVGLTPLAGWSPTQVSVGYRDLGLGRVWITEFDWQDQDTTGPAYAYTEALMGYMITAPLNPQNLDGMFASFESEGRTVGLWQTPPCADLSQFQTFCESRGLSWWSPRSSSDGQTLIDFAFNLDNWHTWIQVYGSVSSGLGGTLNGFPVAVDSGGCVNASADGWTGFRKWACSLCDPEVDGPNVSCCWDGSHEYDWFVCEF